MSIGGVPFACKKRITARISQLAETAIGISISNGYQAGTDQCSVAGVAGIESGGVDESASVARFLPALQITLVL